MAADPRTAFSRRKVTTLKQLKAEIAEAENKRAAAYEEVKGEIEGIAGRYIPGRGSAYREKRANFEMQKKEPRNGSNCAR